MTTVIRVCMKIKENCLLKGPLGVSRTEHHLLPFFKVPYDAKEYNCETVILELYYKDTDVLSSAFFKQKIPISAL